MRKLVLLAVMPWLLASCGSGTSGVGATPEPRSLTVYSGRSEDLVGPILERFEKASGVDVEVRYGESAELAATILEEGKNSPADVFLAQDAGALGAVAGKQLLSSLGQDVLRRVPEAYRDRNARWVGISGRARVAVFNPSRLKDSDLPQSVLALTDSRWKSRVGWAPTNGSFQAFVTALRLLKGDDAARAWLAGMKDNGTRAYQGNAAIVEAVSAGEIDVGLVNHYYALELKKQKPALAAQNHYFAGGDPGALVNVAGAGIVASSRSRTAARMLLEYLLDADAQRYFATETFEYPLVGGVDADPSLPALAKLGQPKIELSALSDLQRTLDMLRETGVV